MKEIITKELAIPKEDSAISNYTSVLMIHRKNMLRLLTENFIPVELQHRKNSLWEEKSEPWKFLRDECKEYEGWFYQGEESILYDVPDIINITYYISNEEVASIFMLKFG